ncbi:MAG TPA: FliH/SctL family protein [Tepidisphaeraceae bacterium]|jgi:flagellar assembly protein FliH
MGLIKSNAAPAALAPFSMRDIEQQAQAIILRARQQADQLLAAAQTEGVQIRQNAYDQGFRAGQEDGSKKGTEDGRTAGKQAALTEHRAKLEQLAKTLTAILSEFDASRTRFESASASEVIRLGVAIARRVTKLQASLDPNVMTENIRGAVQLVVHSSDVRIAINPQQKQVLMDLLPQLRMQWPKISHIELIEDSAIAVGGCRVFTAQGEVDAELDRQIDRIAADLLPTAKPPESPKP